MVTLRTEEHCHVVGFSHTLVDVNLTREMRLKEVISKIASIPMGDTDCALPMLEACKRHLAVDVFVVYTDNETWAGKVHPMEALREYRRKVNARAKLIVVGMTATGFSIADPLDTGALDIVGFDVAAPQIMRALALGAL